MQQQNRREYGSRLWLVESRKHVQSCGNPKHHSAEYKINRENVHESPRSLLSCRKVYAHYCCQQCQQCFDPVTGRTRVRAALALANLYNWKDPSRVKREGFGSSPACGRRHFVRLLRFLFGWRSRRWAAHAMAVHHAGSQRFHVLLHSVHMGNHRFPHIHVVSPA